jgi:hypothetical protein
MRKMSRLPVLALTPQNTTASAVGETRGCVPPSVTRSLGIIAPSWVAYRRGSDRVSMNDW